MQGSTHMQDGRPARQNFKLHVETCDLDPGSCGMALAVADLILDHVREHPEAPVDTGFVTLCRNGQAVTDAVCRTLRAVSPNKLEDLAKRISYEFPECRVNVFERERRNRDEGNWRLADVWQGGRRLPENMAPTRKDGFAPIVEQAADAAIDADSVIRETRTAAPGENPAKAAYEEVVQYLNSNGMLEAASAVAKQYLPNGGEGAVDEARAKFEAEAYRLYQLDWMRAHGYGPFDLAASFAGHHGMDQMDDWTAESLFDAWAEDAGFSGEIWAGLDEFLGCEYRDAAYMRGLLDEADWADYLKYSAMNDAEADGEADGD